MTRRQAAARSLYFLVVVPGFVAGVAPFLWTDRWESNDPPAWLRTTGIALIVAGATALIGAFVRFVIEGSGTPAPWEPTEQLVKGGLYRYVRNPMYLAVGAVIAGEAALLGRADLLIYLAAFFAIVVLFVHRYEQPDLTKRFGAAYDDYRRNVPAWLPRLRPWSG
jgi:protein-S-isoprenylcysteine O-methyltransferase Ste14